ncbi:MAG: hypothetical protein R2867_06800 [Caldilineaceae bacterium]
MQAEQGISGIGLYLVGLGLSDLLFKTMVGSVVSVSGFSALHLPILSDIPVVGEIFFHHNILIYLAYLLVPLSWIVLNKTTFGLKVRAVGHNPEAADSLGVRVNVIRYVTLIVGGALAGLAGASVEHRASQRLSTEHDQMVWALSPWRWSILAGGDLLASLVVRCPASTVQPRCNFGSRSKGIEIPSDLAVMLPYVLTILALAVAVRQVQQPAALTKPYERGG